MLNYIEWKADCIYCSSSQCVILSCGHAEKAYSRFAIGELSTIYLAVLVFEGLASVPLEDWLEVVMSSPLQKCKNQKLVCENV